MAARSFGDYCWQFAQSEPRLVQAIVQKHALPEAAARILVARGVRAEAVPHYLAPTLRDFLPDPSSLAALDHAVARLLAAIKAKQKIAVFGDYDVDGATSAALLKRYFAALGHEIRVYIPDRMREGYGPNSAAFARLRDEGAELIITVDCGTMAHAPLAQAAQAGVDVIVLDHHQSGEALPKAHAIVNPRRADDDSALGDLAAVGVVFMVLVGLQRALRKENLLPDPAPDLMDYLDLVALGTVCDVVPLRGLNRAFVAQGLKVMAAADNVGLSALAQIAKTPPPYNAGTLGFQFGPRINAGGRVGAAHLGAQLLASNHAEEAIGLAARLDEYNTERRALSDSLLAEAEALAEAEIARHNAPPPAFILARKGWHEGVIGIVAARIKDKYRRPTIIIALDESGAGKGSARSVSGVDMGQCVAGAVARGIIAGGGGHAMAAGLTLKAGELEGLRAYMNEQLGGMAFDDAHILRLDAALAVGGASRELHDQLAQLAPFGAGNPEPRFVINRARVIHADLVGSGHVRCVLAGSEGGRLKAIAFTSCPQAVRQFLQTKPLADIVGYLRADDWQGRRDVQFIVHDAAEAGHACQFAAEAI